jgi:hypothetical protein
VPQMDPHMQIARKIQSIETAKIELLREITDLYRGIHTGNDKDITESLGGVVGLAYFLGRKLGIDLTVIDSKAQTELPKKLNNGDDSDIESIQRYLSSSR